MNAKGPDDLDLTASSGFNELRANQQKLVMHFALVVHEVPICPSLAQHQLFSQAMKDLSDMSRPAPVESERELIQVPLEMFGANPSLVGCTKPALEQGGNKVDVRENLDCKFSISLGMGDPMFEPRFRHAIVAIPAIGMNQHSRLYDVSQKAKQTISGCIRNVQQPDSPNLTPI